MRILDVNNQEVKDPDLIKGYLTSETIIIAHHDAISETPEKTERVKVNTANGGVLYEKKVVQEWKPGKGAWDETEDIQRYIEYTPEELAQQEADRIAAEKAEQEAEEEAKRQEELAAAEAEAAAKQQAIINALPGRIDDLEEGIAEVGVIAADAQISIEDLMEAVAEIGVIVAEMQDA